MRSSTMSRKPTTTSEASQQALPSEGLNREMVLIAATFANSQLQMSKSSSAYYENKCTQLAKAKDQLETQAVKEEQDVRLMMKALESRLDGARRENAKLRCDVEKAHDTARQNVSKEISELQDAVQLRDVVVSKLQSRVVDLEEELKGVEGFRLARDKIYQEMEELQMTYEDEQAKHAQDSRELRLGMTRERVRLAAEQRVLEQRREEDVRKLATHYLSQKTREVDEKNKELLQEKLFLSKEADIAREQAEALKRTNVKLREKTSLAALAEAEYLSRGVQQKRDIAMLREQLKTADENLSAMADQYEKRLRKQKKDHAVRVQQLTKERDEARSTSEYLHRELVKLRGLSKQMVEQRSELELFFYEALTHVRRKMLEERRRKTCLIKSSPRSIMDRWPTPRLKRDEELLLISDRDMQPLTPSKSCSDDNNALLSSDTPMDDARTPSVSFPLIAVEKGNLTFAHNRLLPAKRWQTPGGGALTTCIPCPTEDFMLSNAHFSRIPSAPKLRDLYSVEISQLSWSDKERVLQLLFKQLQGRPSVTRPKQCAPTGDTTLLEEGIIEKPETNTFLTETT